MFAYVRIGTCTSPKTSCVSLVVSYCPYRDGTATFRFMTFTIFGPAESDLPPRRRPAAFIPPLGKMRGPAQVRPLSCPATPNQRADHTKVRTDSQVGATPRRPDLRKRFQGISPPAIGPAPLNACGPICAVWLDGRARASR